MQTFLMGQIVPFAGNFAPRGWMKCEGQLLAISQNTALFSLLGTTYGGNGTTNFALPDLRGTIAISSGQGPGQPTYDIGEIGGSESTTLTINEMPMHTHAVTASCAIHANDSRADVQSPAGAVLSQNTDNPIYMADPDGSTKLNVGAVSTSVTIGPSGSGQAFPNLMPYLAVTYCICIEGPFPSRN